MTDLESIIKTHKIKWIKYYMTCHNAFWQYTMKELIGEKNLTIFLLSNFDIKDFRITSNFYKEVLQAFYETRYVSEDRYANQMIYYNKHIKLNNEYVYCQQMLNVGIWYVSDLFINGKPIPFNIWHTRGLAQQFYLTWHGVINAIYHT